MFASRSTAVACCVVPGVIDAFATLTAMEATAGNVTVTTAAADALPIVAVMTAAPGATAVTSPDGLTVATEAELVLQFVAGTVLQPLEVLPAVSVVVAPGASVEALGDTVTLLTTQGSSELVSHADRISSPNNMSPAGRAC